MRPLVAWQTDAILDARSAVFDRMPMRHFIRRVILGATLTPLACNDPTSPLRNVAVTVSVSTSVVRANETTQITTTFQNSGWRDTFVPTPSCGPLFSVQNERGDFLALGSGICLLILPPPLRLAPGESAQFTATWDGRDANGTRTPGDYRVTAGALGGNAVVVRVLD